jgi:cysteinyl-tRNA synthetase
MFNLQEVRISIFNTLSKKKEQVTPLDKNHLKMYVCGPTVYDRPHIGNARSIIVYDLFYRLFSHFFEKVTYVRNITDVDDKINNTAIAKNVSIQELTKETIEFFHNDTDVLNVLRPTFEPLATEHIKEMIEMIEKLIAGGYAYVKDGNVLFKVKSFADYGKLSNRNIEQMISGARVEIADYKEDPLDFILWKPVSINDDKSSVFDSPWGNGRPGWHIECSAMSSKYLGVDFDIHGGGADLQFPHHENEIAQSRCANKGSNFAKYWLHNGFLTVNGEKMSKSLKNFVTVRDLLNQGSEPIMIRYLLLSTHYRKPLDFNQEAFKNAEKSILKFYNSLLTVFTIDNISSLLDFNDSKEKKDFFSKNISDSTFEALFDDLNIAKLIAILHNLTTQIETAIANDVKNKLALEILATLEFIGLIDIKLLENIFNNKNKIQEKAQNNLIQNDLAISIADIEKKIALRNEARASKNWALSDQIRDELLSYKITIEDSQSKTIWRIIKD